MNIFAPDIEHKKNRLSWFPYFTTHGDPYVVTDPKRGLFTQRCKVDTSDADYGRSITYLLSAAPDMQEALECQADYDRFRFLPKEDGWQIVKKWYSRIQEIFPDDEYEEHSKLTYTRFRSLPSILRSSALSKAAGELSK